MNKTTLTYPRVIHFRRALVIRLMAILILACLAFIAGLILGIFSSTTHDGYQVDRIPVVRNLVIPIPTPAVAKMQFITSQISTPGSMGLLKPFVVPVPMPAPPL